MPAPIETTVGSLAAQLGVPVEQVLEICRQLQIMVWSETTPLNQAEAQRIWHTLQPPAPAPTPGAWTAPTAPPGAPLPTGAPATPWPAAPQYYTGFPQPPPAQKSRAGWIIGGVAVGVFAFFVAVGVFVGSPDDESSSGSFSFGDDSEKTELGPTPQLTTPVLEVPDYDRIGQTVGTPRNFGAFEIGTCVNLPTTFLEEAGAESETLLPRPVDCEDSHNAEVFQTGEFAAPDNTRSPGVEELFFTGGEACFDSFAAYIEDGFAEHDFVVLVPLDQQWERLDERSFTCFIYRLDADSMSGSMRDRANN